MFVGHYGVSFAAKRRDPSIPLWAPFVAVQLLDVSWSLFVFFGVGKVRIVPGITASNPLDLYYMPYTHSLVAAPLRSLGAYVGRRAIRRPQLRHSAHTCCSPRSPAGSSAGGSEVADRNCCADAPLPPRLGRSTLQKARRRSMRPDP